MATSFSRSISDNPFRFGVKLLYLCCPVLQHRFLIDRSLVRHLAGVEGRRILENENSGNVVGAARALEFFQFLGKILKRETSGGKDQGAELASTLAGDHDVAHERIEVVDQLRAQR